MKKRIIYIFSIICFISCLSIIASNYILIKNTQKKYNKLKEYNIKNTEKIISSFSSNNIPSSQDNISTNDYNCDNEKNTLSLLAKTNSDLCGWITIPNTNINYPVVKTDNNDYYLNHDFWNNYSPCGTLFIDYQTEPSAFNFIIYGHNMKNGSMLSDLHNYKNYNFLIKNPIIKFETINECRYYKITNILLINVIDFDLSTFIYFPNNQSKKNFIETITAQSIFNIGDDITIDNNFITLCTCDSYENTRLFVVGRQI